MSWYYSGGSSYIRVASMVCSICNGTIHPQWGLGSAHEDEAYCFCTRAGSAGVSQDPTEGAVYKSPSYGPEACE